ncbi:MAG: hypothetical protein ACTIDN_06505 [Acetobacter sp.]|uniref:hypothetical protein n=1 Tax=Acetobacter sp. TaxID=440 RepID=UPI003F92B26B
MPDITVPQDPFITRSEFAMMDLHVRGLQADVTMLKAYHVETKSDLGTIKSGISTIKAELKTMRGWRQFLVTGGIGVGWGLVQGVMHMLGVGTAPP